MRHIITLSILLLTSIVLFAQNPDWDTDGNLGINPNIQMLGTTDNTPIPFRTNNVERMRLWPNSTASIGTPGFTVSQGGFLGLGDEFSDFTPNGPYSLLHLTGGNGGNNPQENGFRSWMKYGTMITANRDLTYMGIKNNLGIDITETVIAWADNEVFPGPDNLVFKFTSTYDPTNPSEAKYTMDGLEVARFAPDGNVGIGDFSNNGFGLNQQPTHRLDVAGHVRIRSVDALALPAAQQRDCILVGDFLGTGDYEVKRINFTENPDEYLGGDGQWHDVPTGGGIDCDWETDVNGIHTGTTTDCNPNHVGIGQSSSSIDKLSVRHNTINNTTTTVRSFIARMYPPVLAGNTWRKAVEGISRYGHYSFGGDFSASNETTVNPGSVSCGVRGTANVGKQAFGVYGVGLNGNVNTIGVYGHASSSNGMVAAGYFAGQIIEFGTTINISDVSLKEDIESMAGAMEIIQQLQPKTYNFVSEEHPEMSLDTGLQYGFVAQEVEEVLPDIVQEVMAPYSLDSLGVLSNEDITYKGVEYTQLIPILTAGIQQQQTQIEELNARLDEMETALADLGVGPKSNAVNSNSVRADYELYQNRPNPFSTSTEIIWRMAEEAQARIIVQDEQGRAVSTLQDGTMSKGLHSVEWYAEDLPAGTYFYSLEVNGQLMVKRAIKLER